MARPPHLYLAPPWEGEELGVAEGQAHHLLRVLRLRPGSAVTYANGAGLVGTGVFTGSSVRRGTERLLPAASPSLTLAVAPPEDRMRLRFLVEKLTELGLARLVWIDCRYRVGMPPPAAKSLGWAVGALQQSRRAWLPSIGDSLSPIGGLSGDIWVADPEGGPPGDPPPALTVVVGPEAGFIPEEVPEGRRVCWASSILRVETAAIVVAAWLETQRLTARNDHSPW